MEDKGKRERETEEKGLELERRREGGLIDIGGGRGSGK